MVNLTLLVICTIVGKSLQMDEKNLLDQLMMDHSALARPVRNVSTPVVVKFGFEILHVVAVVESEQTILQKVWLRMEWRNEFLRWNASEWGGVETTRLDHQAVWTPDIFLHEDVSEDVSTGPENYMTQVRIKADGSHQWLVPTLLRTSCLFNVESFPFDKQSCSLTFTPWTHDIRDIKIIPDPRPGPFMILTSISIFIFSFHAWATIVLHIPRYTKERAIMSHIADFILEITSNYINSSEFDIISVSRTIKEKIYPCCKDPFYDLKYTIVLRRKPLYYIVSVIIPCIIQMVIILFTFFIPPDSGERIGIVITVILVFAVYLELLSSTLPKTSTSTPALSKFYIVAMAESALSLVATCIVLKCHFKATEKDVDPLPRWVKSCFLEGLSKILGVCRKNKEGNNYTQLTPDDKKKKRKSSHIGGWSNISLPDYDTVLKNGLPINRANLRKDQNELKGKTHHIVNGMTTEQLPSYNAPPRLSAYNAAPDNGFEKHGSYPYMDVSSLSQIRMEALLKEVKGITALISDHTKSDEVEKDWHLLRKVLDRLFFVIFLLVYFISSIALLIPCVIPHSH